MPTEPGREAVIAALPDCLKIPLTAALADQHGPIVQVYRIVDAVETALRFVVAHGAGQTFAAGRPKTLKLPDHPSFSDWMVAAAQLGKASTTAGAPADWAGAPVVRALMNAIGPACRDATAKSGLSGLDFREFRNWIFHGGGASVNEETAPRLVQELLIVLDPILAALRDWAVNAPADVLWPVFREDTVPQMFIRIDREEARYAPLAGQSLVANGGEREIEAFRQRLGQQPENIRTFWDEVRSLASHLVARTEEVKVIRQRLDSLDKKPWLWLFSAIGRGKTTVMAAVAESLANAATSPVVVHLFRGGDARNNVDAFASLALHQLVPTEEQPADPIQRFKRLRKALADLRPIVLCDGLDELERATPGAMKRLFGLAQSGGRWLFASRDVPPIRETLGNVSPVWTSGLPPLGKDDLRSLLLRSELPNLRDLVLEAKGCASGNNPWIDAVVDRCDGSPLYLELILAQLAQLGSVAAVRTEIDRMIADPASIPHGLDALYRGLVADWGTGDVATIATPALCLVAQAHGPLTPRAIAELLFPDDAVDQEASLGVIERALSRFGPVLRRQHGPRSGRGVRLDHQSFGDFLARDAGHSMTWKRAARSLARAAAKPASAPSLEKHLFEHGVAYMLRAGAVESAVRTLASLDWNHRRLAVLGRAGIELLLDDLSAIEESAPDLTAQDEAFAAWSRFITTHAHLLRREEACWGPERILLQLTTDYPASAAMRDAAASLASRVGAPPLRLLASASRPAPPTALRFTLDRELIRDGFDTLLQLTNGFLVAVATQGTVQVVRPDGREVTRFAAEAIDVESIYETVEGHLAWKTWRTAEWEIWDPLKGQQVARLDGSETAPLPVTAAFAPSTLPPHGFSNSSVAQSHIGEVSGWLRLMDGGVATWAMEDRSIRVWNHIAAIQRTEDWIRGLVDLRDGRVASHDGRHGVRIWCATKGNELSCDPEPLDPIFPVEAGHPAACSPHALPPCADGHTIVRDIHGFSVLAAEGGRQVARYEGHALIPTGAITIHDERIVVSWAFNDAIHVWERLTGRRVSVFKMHRDWVVGAIGTIDGRVFSWSKDGSFWVWDPLGHKPPIAAFHSLVDPQFVVQPLANHFVASGPWATPLFMELDPTHG
jgi:hypothetical protein